MRQGQEQKLTSALLYELHSQNYAYVDGETPPATRSKPSIAFSAAKPSSPWAARPTVRAASPPIVAGLTVDDLCHLELAYAPPFGSAKDVINLAGFAACNRRDGLVSHVSELPGDPQVQVVDVRGKPLADAFPAPGKTINIPFPTLRARLGELDRSRPVVTLCAFGKMSYFAARVLAQNGFSVNSFSGGIKANVDPRTPAKLPTT